MIKKLIVLSSLCLAPLTAAQAQTILPNPTAAEASAPRPARARGIASDLAVEAAQAANAACLATGAKTTTIVIDSEGVPIAIVSNDGAAAITQRIAMGKAMISLKTNGPSADGAKADPAVMSTLGPPRPGGLPILAGADLVAAIAVSGAPSGATDETCARAAIAKIQARVK